MKLIVSEKAFKAYVEHSSVSFDDLNIVQRKVVKGQVHFELDATKTFNAGLATLQEIRSEFMSLLRHLTEAGLKEVEYSEKDMRSLLGKVLAIDRKQRTIILGDDLNFTCAHPKLPYGQFDCWKRQTAADEFQLRFPVYWERDNELLKNHKFMFKVNDAQTTQLNELAAKQRTLVEKAFVFPSKKGYVVFAHGLNSDLLKRVSEKATVSYNVMQDDGSYRPKTLKFAERISLEPTTDGDDEDGVQIPEQYTDLQKKGYHVFDCKMFTLPAIEQAMRRSGVNIEGVDIVYPKFPEFTFDVEPIDTHPDYKHMPFQDIAFQKWEEAGMLGTIALPTGSGKSLIALRAIEKLRLRTLIVTPTIEMLFQWKAMLQKWLRIPAEEIGLYYADKKEIRPITIITFQSGHRRIYGEVTPEEDIKADTSLIDEIGKLSQTVGLLIMDEGHHAPAPVFQRIMVNIKSRYRMSLTATPYREDKNEVLAFLAIGDVVHTEDYATLAEQQVVSPIDFQRIIIPFNEAEQEIIALKAKFQSGAHWSSDGWGGSSVDHEAKAEDTKALLEHWENHYYVQLRQELNGYEVKQTRQVQVRQLFGFAEGKFERLHQIVRDNPDRKILIFNEFVDGAKVIALDLQKQGVTCHVLTGSTSPKKRRALFKDFKTNRNFMLVTTTVLDEGINVPDCDVVVIFNASRSKRQMIQRVGRGCRYQEGKVERVYELVAAPSDAGRTASSYRHRSAKNDAFIIERMRERRKTGGRLGWNQQLDGYYGDAQSVAEREILLYEWEKADYRDVTKIINVEQQKLLIGRLAVDHPQVRKAYPEHYEAWLNKPEEPKEEG